MNQQPTYIDLLSDFGFKHTFGKENYSEGFLIDFLNELFHDDPQLSGIKTVKYRNLEKSGNTPNDKSIRYDLYCETDKGHRFIVEMQKRNKHNFRDRAAYYVAREISDQGMRIDNEGIDNTGAWNFTLVPVIGVFITNFFVKNIDRDLVVHGRIMNPSSGNVVIDKISYVFVQLEAFDKTPEQCVTGFEKWIYMLKNMDSLSYIPFENYKDNLFARLGEVSRLDTLTTAQRIQYESDLKWARDYHAEIAFVREESLAIGEANGKVIGRNEEKHEIARKMLAKGTDLGFIAEMTGLSVDEIQSLKS